MDSKRLSRRSFVASCAGVATGLLVAACSPKVVKETVIKEVEKIVKETVVETVVVTPIPKPAEKVEIRFQDWSGEYHEAMLRSIEIFEADHPNITVSYEPYIEGWFEKTVAAMVAGTSPDILTAWSWYFYSFYQKQQALDMAPYVDRDFSGEYIEENFVPAQWKSFWNLTFGAPILVAMPKYINHMFLYYNKPAFEEAGVDFPDETWNQDDMAEAALKLTKRRADGTTEQFGGFHSYHWDMERLFYHLKKWGGHIVNPDNPAYCMLDTPGSLEAMEWLRARMWDDKSFAPRLLLGEVSGGYENFTNHKCATIEDGCTHWSTWGKPGGIDFDFDFTHTYKGPVQRASYITTDGWMIWGGTPHPDEAWEVMKWVTGEVSQRIISETRLLIPANRKVIYDWPSIVRTAFPILEKVNLEVVPEALDMGYATDDERFLDQFAAEEIIDPYLERIFVIGDTPVSVMADCCKEVEAAQKE